jgi:hypothetical protein
MSNCKHTRWLRLSVSSRNVCLEISDRPKRLLDNLPDGDSQAPTTIVLVGNRSKQQLLQSMGVITSGKRSHGEFHMSHVPSKSPAKRPMVLIDGDILSTNRLAKSKEQQVCHEIQAYNLPNSTIENVKDQVHHVYSRCLLPMANILCMFSSDLGGLQQTAHYLSMWMNEPRSQGSVTRPWLIIVIPGGNERENTKLSIEMLRRKTDLRPDVYFDRIRLLSLVGHGAGLASNHWTRISQHLQRASKASVRKRLEARHLFSNRHLADFFVQAALSITELYHKPLNPLQISRLHHPIAPDLERHLVSFVRLLHPIIDSQHMPALIIASSFMLDHFAPDMHGESHYAPLPRHVLMHHSIPSSRGLPDSL